MEWKEMRDKGNRGVEGMAGQETAVEKQMGVRADGSPGAAVRD